jgi:hypothetical protein
MLVQAECGWLLMMPIKMPGGPLIREAPLAQWYQYGAFDTAASCEDARVIDWKTATRGDCRGGEVTVGGDDPCPLPARQPGAGAVVERAGIGVEPAQLITPTGPAREVSLTARWGWFAGSPGCAAGSSPRS